MTKQRFIRNITGQIYDTEDDKFYKEDYEGKPIDYEDDVVRLLNKQNKEIKDLRSNKYESIITFADSVIKDFGNEVATMLWNNFKRAKLDEWKKYKDVKYLELKKNEKEVKK